MPTQYQINLQEKVDLLDLDLFQHQEEQVSSLPQYLKKCYNLPVMVMFIHAVMVILKLKVILLKLYIMLLNKLINI